MSAVQDFSMDEGNDISIPISVTSSGVAVDLTGYTFSFVVSPGKGETPVFLKTTTDNTIIAGTSLSVAPQYFIVINAADTHGKAGVYSHELLAINPATKKTTDLHGTFTINQRILT